MFPDVETMLADIAQWLPKSMVIKIGWNVDNPYPFFVAISDQVWLSSERLEDCVVGAWKYWDKNRKDE